MSEVRDAPGANETVFRLIYRSHSRIPHDAEGAELGKILRKARSANMASGVTGALVLYDHWFAQVLEGPREAVLGLFAKIQADPRHDAVEVRARDAAPSRVFARWAMAHVGEHGEPDIPLTATRDGVAEGAAWSPSPEQDEVLTILRDLTRGYGRGA